MRTVKGIFAIAVLAGSIGLLQPQAAAMEADPTLKEYEPISGISGNLSSVGSDTLNNLMTLWAEGFRREYPNVKVQIEGKGSSTAPPALISGTAQLGPMSRPMKSSELDEFEKTFGYKPTPIKVALDALAVYVNKDNPLNKLTIKEVDAIFSSTRSCGYDRDINQWWQVGVSGNLAQKPISLYGRNSASGTYGYYKKKAMCKGDYKPTVKEQPGSAAVVEGVTNDVAGIGYSGMGYKTAGVKALALSENDDVYYDASPEEVYAGTYPLSRFLYVYVNKAPNEPLDPLVREFLNYVLSAQGQQVVLKDGYIPLVSDIANEEMSQL